MHSISVSDSFSNLHCPVEFFQSLLDEKTQWTTRYGCIAGLAELGPDVSIILSSLVVSHFICLCTFVISSHFDLCR